MDDRERASGIPALLSAMEGVKVCIDRLKTGDYLVADRVLVERKTLVDFAASIIDNRLFRQATRLAKSPHRPVFLIEGMSADMGEVKMSRESMQGGLIALSLVFDIPVLRSTDVRESARLIAYAALQLERVGKNPWNPGGRKPKSAQGKKLRLLQSLPGIGRERAERLLAEFESVENCIRANATELCQVPGIGQK
ncbi:MAG: ERCC4 domain-containing protein, partial [Verrucomicrobiales bacterium]